MRAFIEEGSIPEPNTGCWLWLGRAQKGYGYVSRDGKNLRAHRLSFEAYKGAIPDGYYVCHKCDTPACVNPDHLFLGTPGDNMRDMSRKGRGTYPPGEANGRSKLTAAQVVAIRADNRTQQAIADEHGVARSVISEIRSGKAWRTTLPKRDIAA